MPAFLDAFYAIATTGIVPPHSDNRPGFWDIRLKSRHNTDIFVLP